MRRVTGKRRNACRGRTRYRREKDAVLALRHIQALSTRERTPQRAYFCGKCQGWHLTSQA